MAAKKKVVRGAKAAAPKRPERRRGAEPTPASADVASEEIRPRQPGPPVAGIGASAGGLDAFKKFFTAMPPDSGIAFVLIPHLDPKHESLMVELLARHTSMPVSEAADGAKVEANHVYIIPPNKYMTISAGELRLSGPIERSGPQTSIDLFLRSLGDDKQEKAICIILSGTGAHGALGLKAVKEAGGMAMVQDPCTADYSAMPQSAVATGLADFVLPVEDMPQALVKYVRHEYVNGGKVGGDAKEAPVDLNQVLGLIRARTKLDFRYYRKKMLSRRVERRMSLNHFDRIADYLAFLREHPDEVRHLSKDLLISVTSFFRDPEAWHLLETDVIVPLVQAKESDNPIRVWCPGCATGEEPYSLGILLLEQLSAAQKSCPVQIFATDVDEEALEVARQGVYPENIAADISPERLSRFLTRVSDSSFQVSKQLRETVIFARQNLVSDAPFSKLDLVICRNLLIYLEQDVQKKIIALLHFALGEGGSLFLGPSETIGRSADLFEPVSTKWRIYRRIGPIRATNLQLPVAQFEPRQHKIAPAERITSPARLAELAQTFLLRRFALACVVINRNYEVLHFAGPTEDYLVQPGGPPTHDLLSLARPGLESKLRLVIQRAVRENAPQSVQDILVRHGGTSRRVNIEAEPLNLSRQTEGLLLIAFHEKPGSSRATPRLARKRPQTADTDIVRQLEQELETTREDLQSTIEELESSNEELKASNEEIMSINEELQSTNEEMETSKEELQSLNEELGTVNSQLHDKVQDLEQVNNDMVNLLNCTDVATVFLDREFRIRRFTPKATDFFNLIATDLKRPLADIVKKFTDDQLLRDAQQILRDLAPLEKEVNTDDGRWCIRRIAPYRTLDNRIDGVVITFTDITERKLAADAVVRRLAAIVESSADAIFSKDLDGPVRTWNQGAKRLYGYAANEIIGRSIRVAVPEDRAEEWDRTMARVARGEYIEQMETERIQKDGRRIPIWGTYSPIRNAEGKVVSVSLTERDVSEHKRAIQALRDSEERMRAILNTTTDAIITVDHRGIIQSVNTGTEQMFGYAADEMLGNSVNMLMPSPDPEDSHIARYLHASEKRISGTTRESEGRRKDGSVFPMELSVNEIEELKLFVGVHRDLTRRKELEREVLQVANLEQLRIGQELHDDVGQQLTGLAMLVEALAQHLKTEGSPHAEMAARINARLEEVRRQTRTISSGLVPMDVDAAGFRTALQNLCERVREQAGLVCTLECGDDVGLRDTATATHLYRIAQEATHNALRHSRAKNIALSVTCDENDLTLAVRDDGTGIVEPADDAKGLGIRLMRNRADLIGGRLAIGPADGGGTIVTCTLPLRGRHA